MSALTLCGSGRFRPPPNAPTPAGNVYGAYSVMLCSEGSRRIFVNYLVARGGREGRRLALRQRVLVPVGV